MKQLRFEFLREKVIELPVDLEPGIQEELVAYISDCIIAVHKRERSKKDDKSSIQE
jgi:hypothetical protein